MFRLISGDMYVASLALAAPGSDATEEAKLSSGLGGRSSNKALASVSLP